MDSVNLWLIYKISRELTLCSAEKDIPFERHGLSLSATGWFRYLSGSHLSFGERLTFEGQFLKCYSF